jgi:hypothetical protein
LIYTETNRRKGEGEKIEGGTLRRLAKETRPGRFGSDGEESSSEFLTEAGKKLPGLRLRCSSGSWNGLRRTGTMRWSFSCC